MTLTEQIRQRYPHPISQDEDTGGNHAYCVGGAVVLFAERPAQEAREGERAFPEPEGLAQALRTLNPRLLQGEAMYFAAQIIRANDRRNPSAAWGFVRGALSKRQWEG